jgi:hypothetical protein
MDCVPVTHFSPSHHVSARNLLSCQEKLAFETSRDIRKGCRGVNMVKMYENGKMRPAETIPGMGEG